jgi:hypothetical protein
MGLAMTAGVSDDRRTTATGVSLSQGVHLGLAVASIAPGGVGVLFAVADAAFYVYEGDYTTAATQVAIGLAAVVGTGALVWAGGKAWGAFKAWKVARGAGRVGSSFGASTAGAAQRFVGRVVQSGGNKINKGTADALNKATGSTLAPREWGRGIEALKRDHGLPNNHHGKLTEFGFYLDEAGEAFGNVLDYL